MPPIKQNQVIDKSVEQAFVDINEALKVTIDSLGLIVAEGKKVSETLANSKGIKDFNKQVDSLNKNRKEAAKLTQDQINILKKEEELKAKVAQTTAAQERAAQAKNRTTIQERKELERLAKEEAKQLKAATQLTGAYARKSKALNEARKQAKDLAVEYGTLDKRFIKAQKEVNKLDKELKDVDSSLGQSQRNVGNYGDALGNLGGAFGGVVNSIRAATKASLAFIATPLGAVIGAIGLAVAAVTEYFKGSEEGQNKWNKVSAAGSVILGNLSDIVQSLGKFIVEAFENPQQAVEDLWESIKTNLLNRLKAPLEQFKALGKVIEGALDFDWDKVAEGSKDFADASIQLFTGVEGAIDKATDAVSGFIEETKEEIKISNQLSDLEARRDKLQRKLIVDQEKLRAEAREKRLEAEKSEGQERIDLLREAYAIEDELDRRRTEIASINLELKREQNKLSNSTKEDLTEEAELEAELFRIQQDRLKAQRTLQTQINTEINKLNTEQAKQLADINKQILDDEKALNDEILVLEDEYLDSYFKSEDERLKKAQETEEAILELKQNFAKQAEDLATEFLNDQISKGSEGVQAELDQEKQLLDEKLELAGDDQEQKDALQAEFDLKEKELKNKKAKAEKDEALYKIGIDTAIGVAKAVAESPLTFGLPFSAFVAGQGAASAALVASKPIPQFDKGTKSAPKGGFIAGEKRPEIAEHKGKSFLIDTPTYFGDDYAGMKITGGAETADILEQATRSQVVNIKQDNKGSEAAFAALFNKHFEKHSNKMISAIKDNKPVNNSNVIKEARKLEKYRTW